jgi:hypothetical protein
MFRLINKMTKIFYNLPEELNLSRYEVSKNGNIRNKTTKKIIAINDKSDKYTVSCLTYDDNKRLSTRIHILIAKTFIDNPDNKKCVNHKNYMKNDNRVDNLEWSTHKENNNHSKKRIIKCRGRAVYQIDKKTKLLIKKWDKISDVWGYKFSSTISMICRFNQNLKVNGLLNRRSYYGYIWEYADMEDLEGEEWKYYKNDVSISNMGRIKKISGEIFCGSIGNHGYMTSHIGEKVKLVHRLVAKLFISNDYKKELIVNHKDGNKINNNVENLEWVTMKQNSRHAIDIGLIKCKTVFERDMFGKVIQEYKSIAEAAKEKNTDYQSISAACQNNEFSLGSFWSFESNVNNPIKFSEQRRTPVVKLDINKNIICGYISIVQASKQEHIGYDTLKKLCNNGQYYQKSESYWCYLIDL